MEVISNCKETLLNAIRPCEMGVPLSEALVMEGNVHLIIDYLLKGEWKDLEFKYHALDG